MPLPTYHLHEIPDDGLTVDVALDAGWLRHVLKDSDFAPLPDAEGHVRVRLDKHGRDVTVSGTLDAPLEAHCVRCLDAIRVPVHGEFTLHLEPARAPERAGKHSEVELSHDELDADFYENDTIELDHWVREQILIDVPTHPQCEGGCAKPIEPPAVAAPTVREVDPRFLPLTKFAKIKE